MREAGPYYQLYSSRNFPPLLDQFPLLKGMGYDAIERTRAVNERNGPGPSSNRRGRALNGS